jgi:hypothetical protein
MSIISLSTFTDMSGAATPSSGIIMGLDTLDGKFKQKDSTGVVTEIGSGSGSGSAGTSGTSGTSGISGTSGAIGLSGVDGGNSLRWIYGNKDRDSEFELDVFDFTNSTNTVLINYSSQSGDASSWLQALADYVNLFPGACYLKITELNNPNKYCILQVNGPSDQTSHWRYDCDMVSSSGEPTFELEYSISWVIMGGNSGTSGIDGSSGSSGIDGSSGSSGIDGSGSSGTSGSSGISGDGTSGTSGTSGVDGSSGTSGVDGSSGSSGVDGSSGSSGIDGSSGSSGIDGSGSSGTSGSSGISGDGTSGTSGTSGVDGSSGTSGSSGVGGNIIVNSSISGPSGTIIPISSPSTQPEYWPINTTSFPVSVSLSTAATIADGKIIYIKDEAGNATSNNITINAHSLETIDGSSSIGITSSYGAITLIKSGGPVGSWFILSSVGNIGG